MVTGHDTTEMNIMTITMMRTPRNVSSLAFQSTNHLLFLLYVWIFLSNFVTYCVPLSSAIGAEGINMLSKLIALKWRSDVFLLFKCLLLNCSFKALHKRTDVTKIPVFFCYFPCGGLFLFRLLPQPLLHFWWLWWCCAYIYCINQWNPNISV